MGKRATLGISSEKCSVLVVTPDECVVGTGFNWLVKKKDAFHACNARSNADGSRATLGQTLRSFGVSHVVVGHADNLSLCLALANAACKEGFHVTVHRNRVGGPEFCPLSKHLFREICENGAIVTDAP